MAPIRFKMYVFYIAPVDTFKRAWEIWKITCTTKEKPVMQTQQNFISFQQ